MTISGVNIDGNTASGALADQGGGGVFNNGGTVIIKSNGVTATTISGNVANGAAGSGGGILNDGGTLTITGATISGNSAVRAGGGIEATTANTRDSVITVTASTISNNTVGSSPGNGGGVHITDVAGGNVSTFSIADSMVTGNSAANEGGGLWNDAEGTMTVTNTTVSGNIASGVNTNNGGGGLFNNGGFLTVVDSRITGNTANGLSGNGGGVFNDVNGFLEIERTTISGNIASGAAGSNGGGIFNLDSMTVFDSTISGNSASGEGGGAWTSGTSRFSQVTVSGNTAATQGGGIYVEGLNTVEITNSTVALNTAGVAGGGLFLDGVAVDVYLESTIVATNVQGATTPSDVNGTVRNTSQFNLIGVDTGLTGITDGTDDNQIGTAATPINPLLGPLANNGGPTQTHDLLLGSPAINAGSNPDTLTTDQRGAGFPRTVGGQTDIGSVELQDASLSIAATDAVKAEGNAGATSFTFTVTRSANTQGTTTVDFAVSGAEVNGADFVGGVLPSGTVTFADGETTQTITIMVMGDTVIEPDEDFTVTLSDPSTGAVIATPAANGTILNDDGGPSSLSIAATDAVKAEGNAGATSFTFTVTRSNNPTGTATVDFAVSGGSEWGGLCRRRLAHRHSHVCGWGNHADHHNHGHGRCGY